MEQFSGIKLDASRDLRMGFCDYLEAAVPNTNNTTAARTEGCLALLSGIAAAQTSDKELIVLFFEADETRAALRRHLQFRSNWVDKDFTFHISVRAAMRERPAEARTVILSELQQMLDKGVWHGVKLSNLTHDERKVIIRSSMFLKDKYFASGVFEKFKARLVAGGDQQDKGLYEPHWS